MWHLPVLALVAAMQIDTARFEARIDGVTDTALMAMEIGAVAVHPNGRVAVALPVEAVVREFGPSGRLLRTWGGKGHGPGEFQFPTSVGWLDDTLWVWDARLMRVTYMYDDEPPRTLPLRTPGLGVVVASGVLVSERIKVSEAAEQSSRTLTLYSPDDGTELASIHLGTLLPRLTVSIGDGAIVGSQPFDDSPIWSANAASATVVVVRRSWRDPGPGLAHVVAIRASGDTAWDYTLRTDPRPLGLDQVRGALDSLYHRLPAAARSQFTEDGFKREAMETVYKPRYQPPVSSMALADDGSVWLRLDTSYRGEARQSSMWVVINKDGSGVHNVVLPVNPERIAVGGDRVWAVTRDEDGTGSLVGYRMGGH